jgi:hypothetical protein
MADQQLPGSLAGLKEHFPCGSLLQQEEWLFFSSWASSSTALTLALVLRNQFKKSFEPLPICSAAMDGIFIAIQLSRHNEVAKHEA